MDIFIEPVLPKPELLIVGHGRIAETLAVLGDLMGFTITVNDPAADRSAFPAGGETGHRRLRSHGNPDRIKILRGDCHATQEGPSVARRRRWKATPPMWP